MRYVLAICAVVLLSAATARAQCAGGTCIVEHRPVVAAAAVVIRAPVVAVRAPVVVARRVVWRARAYRPLWRPLRLRACWGPRIRCR